MAELTAYPSVDGAVKHIITGAISWADLIIAAGNLVDEVSESSYGYYMRTQNASPDWRGLIRGILLFDTSPLGAGAGLISAVLSLYGNVKQDLLNITPDCNIYSSNPASEEALEAGDFATLGSTPFSTPINYDNWNVGDPGVSNDFAFNGDGLNAISKTGITKLGIRNANYDVSGEAPSWTGSQLSSELRWWANEKGGVYRPKLVITYTPLAVVGRSFGYIIG